MRDSLAAPTVADRLRGARRRGFVGRAAELELFRGGARGARAAVQRAVDLRPRRRRQDDAARSARGRRPRPPDASRRSSTCAARAFAAAFAAELGRAARPRDPVLLLDTFETAGAREDWLREEFAPGLPAGALVVVASRARPGDAWRADPGWRELLRVVSLRNLDRRRRAARCCAARASPASCTSRSCDLTHGHPLALSLLLDVLAQQPTRRRIELGDVPDVVGRLVASFVAGVAERAPPARAGDLARTRAPRPPDVLRAALGEERRRAVRLAARLSFIECGPHGLFPHDLARDVIDADLRWRDPPAYLDVHAHVRGGRRRAAHEHGRARAPARARRPDVPPPRQPGHVRPSGTGRASAEVYADAAAPADDEAIARDGRAPRGAGVGRDRRALARPAGRSAFAAFRGPRTGAGRLPRAAGAPRRDRRRARRAIPARAPCGSTPSATAARVPGEEVLAGRFFDGPRAPTRRPRGRSTSSRCCRRASGSRRPRLAWYYLAFADPDAVAPMMAHIGFERAPGRRLRRRRAPLRRLRARLAPRGRRRVARRDGRARARRRAVRRRARQRRAARAVPARVRGRRAARAARRSTTAATLAGNPLLRARVRARP